MGPKKSAVETKNQTSISNFFGKKRQLDEEKPAEKTNKKQNTGNEQLSPEQKKRIEDNRLKALQRLNNNADVALSWRNLIGESWREALEPEFSKSYFIKLENFVTAERKSKTIFPPESEVFSWTQQFPIKDTKVVIIGQDPYHGPGQAHGLCFSVKPGVSPPPSLVNMYKELTTDIVGFERPKHGHLIGWAQQGVLLLNAVLTVEQSKANAHKDRGWEKVTDATIRWINTNLEGVVFILWGGYAQKKGAFINTSRHLVLKGKHPSPLSAHRGFFGCRHFSKANQYLADHNKNTIDWTDLPE